MTSRREPPAGWIQVVGVPGDARITVDDGQALKPDLLGRVLVQPGLGFHQLVMTRPGHQPVETTVAVADEGDGTIVVLPDPALESAPG